MKRGKFMKIKNRFDDAEVYGVLSSQGNEYLPDEIESNCFVVTDYSDVTIEKENTDDTQIGGTCVIECEKEEIEFGLNADFIITTEEDGTISNIEFIIDEDNFS